jgi:LmbE family N-acetylglucosaminyl deacetylase
MSMTDGSAGHQEFAGAKLAGLRRAEARAGAAAVGADSMVMENLDGSMLPTLDNRNRVIRAVREFQPNVLVTHRTNDYHPDHRYTGVTVQDACYMVRVPNVLPTVPVPDLEPVVLFMSDKFTRPYPFQPDLVFDIGPVIEKKLDAIVSHVSQMTEWIPWIDRYEDELPADAKERLEAVRSRVERRPLAEAERFRDALVAKYGAERGRHVRYAEAYEISEYAAPLTPELAHSLFPF